MRHRHAGYGCGSKCDPAGDRCNLGCGICTAYDSAHSACRCCDLRLCPDCIVVAVWETQRDRANHDRLCRPCDAPPFRMTTPPRVSIGLPVYNGSRYIREAVAAHLSQTWEDFELIISDNTSTDDTFDICTQYARQDKRVRVIRQPRNCGVNRNHLHVFHMARGEYFRWASVDDIPSGDLVRHAVSVLDEDPALVAYVPESANIDEAGEMLRR